MINFFKIFLLVINIISFICVLVFLIFGVYEYLNGPEEAAKWLKRLNFPWSYNRVMFIGFTCMAIMFISYIVRKKLAGV